MPRFPAPDLQTWCGQVLAACDVPEGAAAVTAQVLVRTSLRGVDTHGISRLPLYAAMLRDGRTPAQAAPTIQAQGGVLHVDGHGALGQVVASQAMAAVLERAAQTPLVSCVIRNSGHLAALGTYVLAAAERGWLALLCQTTPPIMALPGSPAPTIGNNPLAFAAPVAGHPPLVLDLACSAVARGHLLGAVREQADTVPAGWALGPDGQPTTDPQQALMGALQPMAGHKGIGLAMMVQCLAGALAANPPAPAGPGAGSAGGAGAFLLVINADRVQPPGAVAEANAQWLSRYRQDAGPQARYPGLRQAESEARRAIEGIPVPDGLLAELRALAETTGIRLPSPTA